jgi:transposase-like protein
MERREFSREFKLEAVMRPVHKSHQAKIIRFFDVSRLITIHAGDSRE